MSYLPIENYGLVGNMHTAALVGRNGSIDWLCWPRFDAPSVFAHVLDDEIGGRFQIAPTDGNRSFAPLQTDGSGVSCRLVYWPDTNVLITRFRADAGVAEVIDYMPVGLPDDHPGRQTLVRRVEMICCPSFDYARAGHPHEERLDDAQLLFEKMLSSANPLPRKSASSPRKQVTAGRSSATFRKRSPISP